MKKTLLAIAIPAALLSSAVNAVELYNDDVNSFAIGGHVAAGLEGSELGDTEVNSVSPRINFEAKRHLGNGFVADAKAEWGINFLDGGAETFTTRLGYIGITHDVYGRVVVGTQWAPYYDIAGVTDQPIAFANDFLYTADGNDIGTARADKMVSYRNGVDFGNAGAINFGLGWQGAHGEESESRYDARIQASLSYSILGAALGYAYNTGDTNLTGKVETSSTQAISLKYGNYGSGLYAAGVFAQNEYVAGFEKTNNYEVLVAYALANSLNFSLNYEASVNESAGSVNGETLYSHSAAQVEYNFASNFVGYAGYQIDLGNDVTQAENDMWKLGVRFYL